MRYAEGVIPVKSLNAFDIEDASGKPVRAAMSSNVILGSVCPEQALDFLYPERLYPSIEVHLINIVQKV